MNGLRVYIDAIARNMGGGEPVFYSRRATGPYYRWSYEEKLGRWYGARVSTSDLTPSELRHASWKGLPTSLKKRLGEHYLEY